MFCGAPLEEGAASWDEMKNVRETERAEEVARAKELNFVTPIPVAQPQSQPKLSIAGQKSAESAESYGLLHVLFPRYIGRRQYALRWLVCWVLAALLSAILPNPLNQSLSTTTLWLRFLYLGSITAYKIFVLDIARARDCGHSPIFGLGTLIPSVGYLFPVYVFGRYTGLYFVSLILLVGAVFQAYLFFWRSRFKVG
jgi:hypothetical protein